MWFDEMGNAKQCYYLVSFWENGSCYDELRFYPGDEAKVFKYIGCNGIKVEAVFLNGASPIKYTEDGAPHLIDATTLYDAIYRYGKPVYALNIGVTWDDLDDEERRILSESSEYYKKMERKRL